MLKRIFCISIICLFFAGSVQAEFAPQFNKNSKDKTDISSQAPKYGEVYKNKGVMENNINRPGTVMERNVNKRGQVMENNVNKPGQVMENNVNKGKQVME